MKGVVSSYSVTDLKILKEVARQEYQVQKREAESYGTSKGTEYRKAQRRMKELDTYDIKIKNELLNRLDKLAKRLPTE